MSASTVYLVPDLLGPPSGIARYCRHVIAGLAGFADPLHVIALTDRQQETALALPGAGYYACQGQKTRFVRKGFQLALQARPALILNGHPHFAALSWSLARLTGAKLVSFIYGVDAWEPLSRGRRYGLQRSDQIIAISRYTARQAQSANQLPAAKIRVLHNCLDPEFSAFPRVSDNQGAPHLLTVARLSLAEQYKGHDYVIRALPILRRQFPDIVYDIVGDGDGRPVLEELAQQAGVHDLVRFHGFVTTEQLRQHYQSASIFVMPSRAEGFGFVFLEAMNYGLPVVGGNADATPEVVIDGHTGYLVEPDNLSAIAEKTAALLANPPLRCQMGQAGQQRVKETFSVSRFRHELLDHMAEMMK